MAEDTPEPVAWETDDLLGERVRELKELIPEAFSEGKVDCAKLKEALGDAVDDSPERYSFTWAGKRQAIQLLQMPSRATLVPCPGESVNFDETQNVFIEGENLEVLKLLYRAYAGRVKMIYIDPPYNTGGDRIYKDDFADPLGAYLTRTGQADSEGNLLRSNPDVRGRFHSDWLSMMYPRLFVARQLLTDDGLIFVSIDDHELANLVLLMNEIFGEENRVAVVAWEKRFTRNNNARMFSSTKDSVLIYRRSERLNYIREERTEKADSIYSNPDDDPRGPWTSVSYVNPATKEQRPNLVYPIENPFTGEQVEHPTNAWKYARKQHEDHVREGRLYWGESGNHRYPRLKKFLSEVSDGMVPIDLWHHELSGTTDEGSKELEELFGRKVFDNPKPTRLVQRMLKMITDPDQEDIILDFFAGSCTTADAVLRLNRADGGNRRFLVVQLPEVPEDGSTAVEAGFCTIAEIGKERIRRAIEKLESGKSELDFEDKDERTEDLAFRVFKLKDSHCRNWAGIQDKDEGKLLRRMDAFTDPLLPGWELEDLIWEVALKEGYSLSSTVKAVDATEPNAVYRVTDGDRHQSFLICLDDELEEQIAERLGLGEEDLFVCRDVALTDDLAANLALQCRLRTI